LTASFLFEIPHNLLGHQVDLLGVVGDRPQHEILEPGLAQVVDARVDAVDAADHVAFLQVLVAPGLAQLHLAHVTSIPFENLDPHRGVHVSRALADLQRKLVHERRGGYCFEQNLLLAAALQALGADVEPMLARVRLGAEPGVPRPRTHLVLRVRHDGEAWLADAGFGRGTPLEPLPFGPGHEHEQRGWRYRVLEDGRELVLQMRGRTGDPWQDLYGFVPEPVPPVDIETSNWFTCAHPRSPFVNGLIVGAQSADGARTILSDWEGLALTEETPGATSVTHPSRDAIPWLLAARFGLAGFELDDRGRVRSLARAAR
jgi:N-hydroxyarylamine O-acetyltransferase